MAHPLTGAPFRCVWILLSNKAEVPAEVLEHEKEILRAQAIAEGKPAAIVDRMVEGRVNKMLKEICLVDQPFVKDPGVTVAQYLNSKNSKAVNYVRYEVGEGMEKREENFAEEVAKQMK